MAANLERVADSPSRSSAKSPRRYNIKVNNQRPISAVQVVTAVRRAGHLDSRRFDIESVFSGNVCFIIQEGQVEG
jgi:hypothetical protein